MHLKRLSKKCINRLFNQITQINTTEIETWSKKVI